MNSKSQPSLSVVVPVFNEKANLRELISEIKAQLTGKVQYELIVVDDGSTDGSLDALRTWFTSEGNFRFISHSKRCGKSTAIRTGALYANASLIANIDGDHQDPPSEILNLLHEFYRCEDTEPVGLVSGRRICRKDTLFKRITSTTANFIRRYLLKDDTFDSACGLKLYPRKLFLQLPFFSGYHRFLPALILREGYAVKHVDVLNRKRASGRSKYYIWDRIYAIIDMIITYLLTKRFQSPAFVIHSEQADKQSFNSFRLM